MTEKKENKKAKCKCLLNKARCYFDIPCHPTLFLVCSKTSNQFSSTKQPTVKEQTKRAVSEHEILVLVLVAAKSLVSLSKCTHKVGR